MGNLCTRGCRQRLERAEMATQQAVIALVDIGGYTQFMKRQKQSLAHAEAAITELLSSVIDATVHPLTLNKLEGDAALFCALATEYTLPAAAKSALNQVDGFFQAFAQRKQEMVKDAICECGGCGQIGDLTIKAVLHCGEVTLRKFRRFNELSGMSVITAHRLLKNHVPLKEYLLVTDAFTRIAGGIPGRAGTPLVEECAGVGQVDCVYYEPDRSVQLPAVAANRWRQFKLVGRVMTFLGMRRLGLLKQRKYHSLAALVSPVREDPVPRP